MPSLFSIRVHNIARTVLGIFAGILLFCPLTSSRQKQIPVLASAGSILAVNARPVWTPTPDRQKDFIIVVCK